MKNTPAELIEYLQGKGESLRELAIRSGYIRPVGAFEKSGFIPPSTAAKPVQKPIPKPPLALRKAIIAVKARERAIQRREAEFGIR